MGIDATIGRLAESQHGVIAHRQAVALGATPDAIRHRLGTGRWQALRYPRVYGIGGSPRRWEQRLMGLVLAAGPGAAASHRSAAALLRVPGFPRGPVEVTTPRRWRQRADPACVHSSRLLLPEHVTRVEGIPTTSAARSLIDLAAVLRPGQLARAFDNCLARGIVTTAAVEDATRLLASRGRAGIALMRLLLDERSYGYVALPSELEALFLAVVRDAGLPEPERQVDVGGSEWVGRVDFAYPRRKLLIELDSRRHHTALLDLESDRIRDNRLTSSGWRIVRITWAQLTTSPEEVVSLLRQLLAHAA